MVAPQEAVVDHKRKLEDIETEEAGQNGSTEPDSVNNDGNVAEADGSEAKRPRLDDENDEADASGNFLFLPFSSCCFCRYLGYFKFEVAI